MKKKYLGVKEKSEISLGNKNCIYEEQENDIFLCVKGIHKGHKCSKEEIEHDFRKGFLIKL